MKKTVTLTGWKAIGALVVAGGFLVFQFVARQQTLETDAVEKIKLHLVGEYTRHYLPELQSAMAEGSFSEQRASEIVSKLTPDNIDIDITALGKNGRYVARTEIAIDGASPPGGKSVRYFRMRHATITGWQVVGETSKWAYYLAF